VKLSIIARGLLALLSHRQSPILLAAILALAAIMRMWGLAFGLPHTEARPDEMHVIGTALSFLRGRFDPPFYDYPWLYMWVLAGAYYAYYVCGVATGSFSVLADFFAQWPMPFFLISRTLSVVAGTATVLVLYRLGRKLAGDSTGLVAAFFLSLAFLHVRDSHFGTTDITMTLLVVASVSLLLSAHTTRKRYLFALAGTIGGLATATKYSAVFVVVPMLVSHIVHIVRSPLRWRAAVDLGLLYFSLPFLGAVLLIGMPFVLFDADRFWRTIPDLVHSTLRGTGNAEIDRGWMHHLTLSLRYGLGLPLLGAGLAGGAAMLLRGRDVGLILLAFPISYYLAAGGAGNRFFRYAIPVVPFLCLSAAWLVTASLRSLMRDAGQRRQSFALGSATAVVAVAIVLPSALSSWRFDRIISETDNRVIIANWFKENVRPGESVLQSGSFYGHAQIDPQIFVPWVWDQKTRMVLVDGRRAAGRPDWILLQESPLPSTTQQIVEDFLKEDYQIVRQFIAFSPNKKRIYDRQDAFFAPYAGFDEVSRPGPNFTLYKRVTTKAGDVCLRPQH
jgi:4-amino-4-deoxy-L-arabinose transferase-like glycosyltransferase